MNFTFKVWDKIKEAWPLYKENLGLFILLMGIIFVVQLGSMKYIYIISAVLFLASILVGCMAISFLLSVVDKKEFHPFSKKYFPTINQIWNFIKTYVLFTLIVSGGMLVFLFLFLHFSKKEVWVISPLAILSITGTFVFGIIGMYLQTRLIFSCFISIDKNKGAIESIKDSWNMTRGRFWFIFGRTILIGLFVFAGFIALLIGALITYPIGMLLYVMLYRDLRDFKQLNSNGVKADEEIKIAKSSEAGSPDTSGEVFREVAKEAEISKEEVK